MNAIPDPASGARAYFRLLLLLLLLWVLACVQQGCHAAGVVASWYGEEHRGRPMANRAPFDPDALTCASWRHPLGTRLRVAHGRRTVTVTVTDRGPARRLLRTRQLDLSRAAFARLAAPELGLVSVQVTRLP